MVAKIHQALQPALNEMFFATRLILVEGQEDIAYISTYLNLLGQWDEYRRTGCHLVPVNGKSQLLQPLVIAKNMGIPTFTIFDADADQAQSKWQPHKARKGQQSPTHGSWRAEREPHAYRNSLGH